MIKTDTVDSEGHVWPARLSVRDTKLHDDMNGGGQRIYTTAGRGYTTVDYVRADLHESDIAALRDEIKQLNAYNDDLISTGYEWAGAAGSFSAKLVKLYERIDRVLEPFARLAETVDQHAADSMPVLLALSDKPIRAGDLRAVLELRRDAKL